MTTLKDRQHTFEEMFSHDQELLFKALARRNRYFGLWVAEKLQLAEEAAEEYAQKLVDMGVENKATQDAVITRALSDLTQSGISVSQARLEKELETCFLRAKKELK